MRVSKRPMTQARVYSNGLIALPCLAQTDSTLLCRLPLRQFALVRHFGMFCLDMLLVSSAMLTWDAHCFPVRASADVEANFYRDGQTKGFAACKKWCHGQEAACAKNLSTHTPRFPAMEASRRFLGRQLIFTKVVSLFLSFG